MGTIPVILDHTTAAALYDPKDPFHEAFGTDAAVTATELLRFGHSWVIVHAVHTARPSPAFPTGRFLLTLTPSAGPGSCPVSMRC